MIYLSKAKELKDMEKYSVIENKNIGTLGNPEMVETVLYRGSREECLKYEETKRSEYRDRTKIDCYTISDAEATKRMDANKYWDSLSDDEKKEKIVVDGKTYFKAMYDFYNKEG